MIEVFGPKRVGVKISPVCRFNDQMDSTPSETYKYFISKLNEKGVGFLEVRDNDPLVAGDLLPDGKL